MKSFTAQSALALLSVAGLVSASPVKLAKKQVATGFSQIAYFANWNGYGERQYNVSDMPVDQLSQVLYSFASIDPNGTVYSGDTWADFEQPMEGDDLEANNARGHVGQLWKMKNDNRHLKVILSIGGFETAANFSSGTESQEKRDLFAKTSIDLMQNWGFDGIDVDWEFPETEEDGKNYLALLDTLREGLDTYSAEKADNYHFLLTSAMGGGQSHYEFIDLKQMGERLDNFNLMSYDFMGSWDDVSGHQANLFKGNSSVTPYSIERAVDDWTAAGIPAEKIIMGIPLYGRAFTNTEGLGEKFDGTGLGSRGEEGGVWDAKDLPFEGATVEYDEVAGANYMYDAESKTFVSYDDVEVVDTKVQWLMEKGLGGAMYWEISQDRAEAGDSLVNAAFEGQGGADGLDRSENLLSFPDSQFDNIKGN